LPRQDHVYKTTDESFRFHNKIFDEMRCKLDSTDNPGSFEKYPTHLNLIQRNPPPRGGFLFTMFPHQEPCVREPPSKNCARFFEGVLLHTVLGLGVLLHTVLDEGT